MLRYKEKTPKALNELLLSSPYFQANWKAIAPTYRLLNRILQWNHADADRKGGESEITREVFSNLYGWNYAPAIQALEQAELLNVTREFSKGHCQKYRLTSKAHVTLADANREYLYLLLNDPVERRKIQKRASDRGYNAKTYGDTRDAHKAIIDGISFREAEVDAVCTLYSDEKAAHVRSLLINIIERDYSDLKFNAKDGRVWTPYAQLPAEIKAVGKVNGYSYRGTMDIRSCYPSCWASYVASIASDPATLQAEVALWESLFLDKSKDPKAILSLRLDIPRDDIKEVLIQYFNGHGVSKRKCDPFRKFDAYLQAEFPLLYSAWKQTDIKQTGNNIGKMFETRLMLDGSIYEKADELGLAIGYEYDGMSFYAKDGENIEALLDFIQSRSLELLGFALVIVQKDNRELIEQLAAQTLVERTFAEVQENDERLAMIRAANHRKGIAKPNWQPYYTLKAENEVLLTQLARICGSQSF